MTDLGLIPALRNIILASAEVTAITDRVIASVFTQDMQLPAVMLYSAYGIPFEAMTCDTGCEISNIRVECAGDTPKEAYDLWVAVNKSLRRNFAPGIYSGHSIVGIFQSDGHTTLQDKRVDGNDEWFFRVIQSFNVSHHIYEAD